MVEQYNYKLNCQTIVQAFKGCLDGKYDVKMRHYLLGVREILRLYTIFTRAYGREFCFEYVYLDGMKHFHRLKKRLEGRFGEYHETINTMMEFEIETNLLKKNWYVSGSTTLWKLHCSFLFVYHFLNRIYQMNPGDKTSEACQSWYEVALGPYQPWLIIVNTRLTDKGRRNPTRTEMLHKLFGEDDQDIQSGLNQMQEMCEIIYGIYTRVGGLYNVHNLKGLP